MSPRLSFAALLAVFTAASCRSPSPPQTFDLPSLHASQTASAEAETQGRAHGVSLTFVAVDDEHDVLASFDSSSGAGATSLPAGVKVIVQNAPVGRGKSQTVHYAIITPVGHETAEDALTRARPFFESLPVPAGDHFAFQRYIEFNEDADRFEVRGYQTVLLSGPPSISEKDIDQAVARNDAVKNEDTRWSVALTFTKVGGERFRQFTASHIGFRFAIVVDGVVESAPVILNEIGGGQAQITMGSRAKGDVGRDANALAEALSTH